MGVVHGHPEQRRAAIQSATATVTASLNDTALGELKVGEPCSLNGTGTLTLHMAGDAQYAYVVIKVGDKGITRIILPQMVIRLPSTRAAQR